MKKSIIIILLLSINIINAQNSKSINTKDLNDLFTALNHVSNYRENGNAFLGNSTGIASTFFFVGTKLDAVTADIGKCFFKFNVGFESYSNSGIKRKFANEKGEIVSGKIEKTDEDFTIKLDWSNNDKSTLKSNGRILIHYNLNATEFYDVTFFSLGTDNFQIDFKIGEDQRRPLNSKQIDLFQKVVSKYFPKEISDRTQTKKNEIKSDNKVSVIGTPIRIGNLEIAQNDFPNRMNWEDANKACSDLGDGWRLPTKEEFNTLYLNKDKIGGFANGGYWSSTEIVDSNYAWFRDFYNGSQNYYNKVDAFHVRAIRAF